MSTATARLTSAEFRALDLGEEARRDYLWDGEIVHVMPPRVPHSTVTYVIAKLLEILFPADAFMVWTEQPLALREGYEPQPDVMVLRGTPLTRGLHPPTLAEVVLVVEVADSSLVTDLARKAPGYAAEGISPYLVADVRGRRIVLFRDPDPAAGKYRRVDEFGRGDRVPVGETTIAVDDVFACLG